MAQYILSDVFTAIAETSGTIVNFSNVPVEISDSTKNRTGIILFPRQHFPFSKAVYAARAPGAIGTAFIGVISTGCCCNGSGSPADSESDTETETETETDTQTESESQTDTETDTQTETETQIDTETETETESDSGDEFDSEDVKDIFDSESESETDDFYDDDHFDPEDNEFSKFDLDEIFDDSDFELSGFTEEDIKNIFKD